MFQKLFFRKGRSINQILSLIESADDYALSQIMQAVVRRYSKVYPDWEVMFLSLPKDPEERRAQLAQMLEMLDRYGTL